MTKREGGEMTKREVGRVTKRGRDGRREVVGMTKREVVKSVRH